MSALQFLFRCFCILFLTRNVCNGQVFDLANIQVSDLIIPNSRIKPNSDPCKTDNPHAYLYSCQEEENPSLCRPCDFYCNGTQIKDCHAENARCVCEKGYRVNDNGICVEQCPGDLTTPKTTQSTPTRTPSLPPTTTPAPGPDPCSEVDINSFLYTCKEGETCRTCNKMCDGTLENCKTKAPRCLCKDGFVVDSNGMCVEQSKCPVTSTTATQAPTAAPTVKPTTARPLTTTDKTVTISTTEKTVKC